MQPVRVIEVEANLAWLFFFDEPSKRWIAVCDPIKLTLEADSISELRETIDESVSAMLDELHDSGDLDRFLREHGWTIVGGAAIPFQRPVRFEVPWELIRRQRSANDPYSTFH